MPLKLLELLWSVKAGVRLPSLCLRGGEQGELESSPAAPRVGCAPRDEVGDSTVAWGPSALSPWWLRSQSSGHTEAVLALTVFWGAEKWLSPPSLAETRGCGTGKLSAHSAGSGHSPHGAIVFFNSFSSFFLTWGKARKAADRKAPSAG